MNYPHGEELRLNAILEFFVQHDSDGYGEDDCNVMFQCSSDGEAIYTSDEGSGDEILGNSEQKFPRGDGGAPGIFVPPAAMADQNAPKARRTQSKVSKRAQRMVGVPESKTAPAQAAVEVNVWGAVDEFVWPNTTQIFR